MFTSGPRRCRGPVFFAAGYGGYGNSRLGLYAGCGPVRGLRLCELSRHDGRAAAVGRDQIGAAHTAQARVPGGKSLLHGNARQNRSRSTQAETVVLLSKGEIDSKKVRVEFSLEDMDMSGFQKGATYEQIKAYVLEHTGLKVSSLYISQIKRKCGLDVGQNYNLSKKEDAKVPKCPPEKEAAIRDALKYFQMI